MIHHHPDLIQGSEEWHAARCGMLTASEMDLIITPTLKTCSNDKERAHLYELLGQRITRFVEPSYVSDAMLRGQADEFEARAIYAREYAPVEEVGFITNDRWGFTIGYSPDGLVGADGLIECKSRGQKFQVQTIISWAVPKEHIIQCQTGLLVSERQWVDYVSYCGGLPMTTIRVHPDPKIQDAIISAAAEFEKRIAHAWGCYRQAAADSANRLIPTERRIEQEIVI